MSNLFGNVKDKYFNINKATAVDIYDSDLVIYLNPDYNQDN